MKVLVIAPHPDDEIIGVGGTIANRVKAGHVGDNLTKDFQAPQQLGMKSIYFKNPDGLYSDHENSNLSIIRAITDFKI